MYVCMGACVLDVRVCVCACVLDVRECVCVCIGCTSVYVCACILHTCKRKCVCVRVYWAIPFNSHTPPMDDQLKYLYPLDLISGDVPPLTQSLHFEPP